jgi:glutathione S-transferase
MSQNGPADEQHNGKAAEVAQADIHNCLRVLNEALADKSLLLGGYMLAHTYLNSVTDWLRFMKTDLSAYANLNAWTERCAARPAYRRVIGAPQLAIPPPTV